MDAITPTAGPFRPSDLIKCQDRVAVPLAAGGEGAGEVVWYRGNPETGEQVLGVRLDADPRVVVPAPAASVRILRSATLSIVGAS